MEKKYLFIVFTKEREENHRKGWTVNLTRKRLINIKNSTKIRSLSKY